MKSVASAFSQTLFNQRKIPSKVKKGIYEILCLLNSSQQQKKSRKNAQNCIRITFYAKRHGDGCEMPAFRLKKKTRLMKSLIENDFLFL